MNDIKVVVTTHKNDLWFCRICVASIRYYYPDIDIYLLTDQIRGSFSTKELENSWNVKLVKNGILKFGWGAPKIHFMTDPSYKDQNFLIIDSDVVFIGPLLNAGFLNGNYNADFIISSERFSDTTSSWFKNTYFDIEKVRLYDYSYKYPGYCFNTGQLFYKGGALSREELLPFFNFGGAPSWKLNSIFPLVDQSVFNYLLPLLEEKGSIKVQKEKFMLWSEDPSLSVSVEDINTNSVNPFMIHWAGALRTSYIAKMSHHDILNYFQSYYYSKVMYGNILKKFRNISAFAFYYTSSLNTELKKIIKYLLSRFTKSLHSIRLLKSNI